MKVLAYHFYALIFLFCHTVFSSAEPMVSAVWDLDLTATIFLNMIKHNTLTTLLQGYSEQECDRLIKNVSPAMVVLETEIMQERRPIVMFFTSKNEPEYTFMHDAFESAARQNIQIAKFMEVDNQELFKIVEYFKLKELPLLMVVYKGEQATYAEVVNSNNFEYTLDALIHMASNPEKFLITSETTKKKYRFHSCLEYIWGIDYATSSFINDLVRSALLNDNDYDSVVDDFIAQSHALELDFSQSSELQVLDARDGVLVAPEQHKVVFENPWIRVLYGSTRPGEQEPMHLHSWPSLLIILKPTPYAVNYFSGLQTIEAYPIGVYALPEMGHYACQNVGENADACLRFEIKKAKK